MVVDAGRRRVMSTFPASLAALLAKKEKLEEELRNVEKQVYDLETSYLHDTSQCGNVLKGFDGFLSSTKNASNTKRPRKFQPEDRLFSLSSVTSPAVKEKEAGLQLEGRPEAAVAGSRLKVSTTPSNGPNKQQQKRGRTGPRDGKRIRTSTEAAAEETDELDAYLR